jgi:HlyD family secretion protein
LTAFSKWIVGGLIVVLVALGAAFLRRSVNTVPQRTPRDASVNSIPNVVFASPGRVEGRSETTQVEAAADGVLRAVFAKEGEFVKKGALLGKIACDDLTASLQTAQAEAAVARQARARVLRGTRVEEKRVAAEKTVATRAASKQAKSRLEMLRGLYQKQDISRATYEQAVRDSDVAEANLRAAIRTEKLLAAPPLKEEIERADAEVTAAVSRIRTVQAKIRKCSILSPMAGTVLRVYARPGEAYSTVIPRPLFSLADASGRRVRAEIDERDIAKVSIGQSVVIQADALDGQKINGSVERISPVMGRKSVFTGDPSDKSDRDVLEAIVELRGKAWMLPIGLRVSVLFLSGSPLKQ